MDGRMNTIRSDPIQWTDCSSSPSPSLPVPSLLLLSLVPAALSQPLCFAQSRLVPAPHQHVHPHRDMKNKNKTPTTIIEKQIKALLIDWIVESCFQPFGPLTHWLNFAHLHKP